MATTRTCPYCAEEIPAEAIRCRYCRSRLGTLDPEAWYRDQPGRRLAGVAAAVAAAFAVPTGVVRLAFIVLTFLHLVGPLLYGALWLLIPFAAGEESPLERALGQAKDLVGRLRGRRPQPSAAPAPPSTRDGDAGMPGSVVP